MRCVSLSPGDNSNHAAKYLLFGRAVESRRRSSIIVPNEFGCDRKSAECAGAFPPYAAISTPIAAG
jgi:hypothetical protein